MEFELAQTTAQCRDICDSNELKAAAYCASNIKSHQGFHGSKGNYWLSERDIPTNRSNPPKDRTSQILDVPPDMNLQRNPRLAKRRLDSTKRIASPALWYRDVAWNGVTPDGM